VNASVKGNLGKDLIHLPPPWRTDADIRDGIVFLQQTIEERDRMGVPAVTDRSQLILGLLRYGDERQVAQARTLLDINRRQALLYYSPQDGVMQRIDQLDDRLLFREGKRERADANFARKIEAAREFMRTADAARLSSHDSWRANMLSQSLSYRALYAHEHCRKDQALAFLREAVDFDRRALGPGHDATRSAMSYLDHLSRQGRMMDTTGFLLPVAELDALNR
ncbi:hypothetical protein AB4084_20445, partial [Lysobacter sp. 2RAB21]